MKKLAQKGFTVVEGLLIVVILGIIGGVGYYVYSQTKNNDNLAQKSDSGAAESGGTKSDTPKDETADWLLYEPPGKEFSTKLADGWALTTYNNVPYLYNFTNQLAIVPGQKATVTDVQGGRDFATAFGIGYITNEQMAESSPQRGTKSASLKAADGKEVEVYHFTQDNQDPMLDVPYKGQEYTYLVRGSKGMVRIVYSFGPNDTDYHKEVEKILPTIKVNN